MRGRFFLRAWSDGGRKEGEAACGAITALRNEGLWRFAEVVGHKLGNVTVPEAEHRGLQVAAMLALRACKAWSGEPVPRFPHSPHVSA